MMFMTSHKVRQPVANIIGLSCLLNDAIDSKKDLKILIENIQKSAISLDTFTKEFTVFMEVLGTKKDK